LHALTKKGSPVCFATPESTAALFDTVALFDTAALFNTAVPRTEAITTCLDLVPAYGSYVPVPEKTL